MSNHLAIATVTEVIKTIIQEKTRDVSGVVISTKRPLPQADHDAAVNIFLLGVNPNETWRDSNFPVRGRDGAFKEAPKTGLDLTYIISFYGDDTQQEPQRLLGSTVTALQSYPVLDREKIKEVIEKGGGFPLKESDLDQSPESIKLIMLPLSVQDSLQIWSSLQAPCALSVFYEASVVILEGDVAVSAPALPVGG